MSKPNFKKYFTAVLIGVLLIGVALIAGGQFDLFNKIPNSDKLFHMTGGAIAAWLVSLYFSSSIKHLSGLRRIALLVAGACLIGVVWEFAEYASTILTQTAHPLIYHYFHGGDLTDTLGDILADIIGAFLYAICF